MRRCCAVWQARAAAAPWRAPPGGLGAPPRRARGLWTPSVVCVRRCAAAWGAQEALGARAPLHPDRRRRALIGGTFFFARARTHGLNIDKAIKKNINGREHTFDRGEYSATWCVRNRSHGLPASRFLISRWETSHTHSQSVSKTGQETGCFHFSKNKSVLSSLAHQGYAEPRAHRPSHSAQTVRVQQRTESGSGLL